MDVLVSVIIPIYNSEKYLEECLDSVINQTYTNLQIILIDDGSIDNSLAICKKYKAMDSRITLFSKENGGVASARNFGLKNAKGEFIAWLDSDDTIEASYIEYLYNSSKENGWLPVIAVNGVLISNVCSVIEGNDIVIFFLKGKIPSNMWSTFFHRSLYSGLKFRNYPIGEDAMMLLDIFTKAERILCVPMKGYMYRDNPLSISRKLDEKDICLLIDEVNEQIEFVRGQFPCAMNAMNYKAVMFALGIRKKYRSKDIKYRVKQIIRKNIFQINIFKLSRYEIKNLFFELLF